MLDRHPDNPLGRLPEGEEHWCHILTEDDVAEARYLRRVEGWSYTMLAWDYCVSPATIRQACIGITWQSCSEPVAPIGVKGKPPTLAPGELTYHILRTDHAGGSD